MKDLQEHTQPDLPDSLLLANRFISHFVSSSWGDSIVMMEKTGKAFARVYWFNDDSTTIYLDWLSVNLEIRNQGIGKELQEARENIGKHLGYVSSCLWVKKDSWMHKWYQRRGYSDIKDHETEENSVWMTKQLNGC